MFNAGIAGVCNYNFDFENIDAKKKVRRITFVRGKNK
jgi:hypothetical protein